MNAYKDILWNLQNKCIFLLESDTFCSICYDSQSHEIRHDLQSIILILVRKQKPSNEKPISDWWVKQEKKNGEMKRLIFDDNLIQIYLIKVTIVRCQKSA